MEYEYQDCTGILADGEYIVVNRRPDGGIDTFFDTSQNPLNPTYVPFELGQACCEVLLNQRAEQDPDISGFTYTWDSNMQQCKWLESVDCDDRPPFNVVLNPTPNGGALFEVEDGETCVLDVQFDYMFKFDCQTMLDVQLSGVSDTLTDLYNQLDNEVNTCNTTQEQLDNLDGTFNYVIQYTNSSGDTVWFCLNSVGVSAMQNLILTSNNPETWNEYLETGNPGVLPQNIAVGIALVDLADDAEVPYWTECPNGFELIQETIVWLQEQNQLEQALEVCTDNIATIQNTIDQILAEEAENCIYVSDIFEDLSVEAAIDIQNPIEPSIVETVFSEEIFNIGSSDLITYLIKNIQNPLYIEGYNGITCTNTACDGLAKILTQQLISQGIENEQLTGDTYISQYNQLLELTGDNPFTSNWLRYNNTITDPAVISAITNENINLSIRVVDGCSDFAILVDRIVLNKLCQRVINEDIFVSKNPAFDLTKVCDNKKSWVSKEVTDDREFDLSMRETDYDTNHHRLVINTKEVDLNMALSNGIETDVWCYINDNPCVLEPCTNSSYTGLTGSSCCCGQTPLSGTNITGGTIALPPASAVTPCEKVVGEEGPAGGIVYWVNPDDPCEGYEVMPFNQTTGATWIDSPLSYIGGTSQAFGTGQANTDTIIGHPSPAAVVCDALSYNGFDDWFLPSIGDLITIATNTTALDGLNNEQGYWSSSEGGPTNNQNSWLLVGGNPSGAILTKKSFPNHVRAVRYFNTNPCDDIYNAITGATVLEQVTEEYTDCSWIYKFNSGATPNFSGVWLAGMPDGTLGVFSQTTISGGSETTIDFSQVTSKDCCESYNQAVQDFAMASNKGSYYTEFKWDYSCKQCKVVECTDPHCADYNEVITSEVTGLTTVKEFNHVLTSELINAQCRKVDSHYPLLKALYERYMNSTEYCPTLSSQFDYSTMGDFTDLVGNYWVDLIEQVVPSTTIWEANQIYGNTIYDQQKFQYKGYSLFPCRVPNEQLVSGLEIIGTGSTDVDIYTLDRDGLCESYEQCSDVYIITSDCGSEFLGTVIDPNNPIGSNNQIIISN